MNALKSCKTSKGNITYDIYIFLSEIRKRPILWDRTNSRTRVDIDSCWYDLTRVFISHFDQLKFEEQEGVAEHFRNTWNMLRQCLMKTITRRANIGNDNVRMYRFVRHMEFYLESRGTKMEDVVTEQDLKEVDLLEKKHYEMNGLPVENKSKDNSNKNCFGDGSFDPHNICEANTKDGDETYYDYRHQQQCVAEVITNGHITGEHNSRDPEQAFFDSLRPVLREMNESQKLDFKIQTLKALRKYQTVQK